MGVLTVFHSFLDWLCPGNSSVVFWSSKVAVKLAFVVYLKKNDHSLDLTQVVKKLRFMKLWSCSRFFLRSWALNRRPVGGWCLDKCLAFCSAHISSTIYRSSKIKWSIVTYSCVNLIQVWWTRRNYISNFLVSIICFIRLLWLSYSSIKWIRK